MSPARQTNAPSQPSAEAAAYIVNRLLEEGLLAPSEVARYSGEMQSEIARLEARITHLRSIAASASAAAPRAAAPKAAAPKAAAKPAAAPAAAAVKPARAARKAKKKGGPSSAAILASQQLQGRYIRAIKKVPGDKREFYKAMAKEKGREAAVMAMEATL
jgi:hypothetical protein